MRTIIGIVALIAIFVATKPNTVERFMLALSQSGPPAQARPAPQPEPAQSSPGGYRTVTLNDNGRGSFQVEARVEGRSLDFIVDTGASYVALRETAAAKLGIHPAARDYTIKVHTANGIGKAAPITLDRVEINGITVRNVRAIVHPDEALSVNLLGMTFLSKVKWSHDRGRLVLEQ
jgi:aspartyl protease family protein